MKMVSTHPARACTMALVACAGLAACIAPAHAIITPNAPHWILPSGQQPGHPQPTASGSVNAAATRPPHASAYKFGMLGKPDFDIRIGGTMGTPLPDVIEAIQIAYASPATSVAATSLTRAQQRNIAIQRVQAALPGVTIDFDQYLGTVASVRHWQAPLTPEAAVNATPTLDKVREFVDANADLFEITSADLDAARIARNYITKGSGTRHLTFQQQLQGFDIFGAVAIANLDRAGRIVNFGSQFVPDAVAPEAVAALLSPQQALVLAAEDVGIALASQLVVSPVATDAADLLTPADPRAHTTWQPVAELESTIPITTEFIYFPRTRLDVRPAYAVAIPTKGAGNTYDTIIDAVSGEVLKRSNRLVWETTQPATYRVFPGDSPAPGSPGNPVPSSFQFPYVDRTLVTVTPEQIRPFSPNGWIPDGTSTTVGNNVDARPDPTGGNVAGTRPTGGANRTFDFPLNTSLEPGQWTNAAVTQMFFWVNEFHDRMYAAGFDEVSGNFQTSNFARGGAGGDAIIADGQDGGGFNNANWNSTGVDGSTARMQMYLWDGATPDRDGTVDGDIVFHELGHGLSIRLHQGITNQVTRGMGEGWSDFCGVTLNAEPSDDFNAVYCVGPYCTRQLGEATYLSNYYFGIRRFPYSTNFSINPQTLADIDPNQQFYPANVPRSPIIGNDATSVHNMGEVWCNTLLNARATLSRTMGFAANERIIQLVVDGMKLHPVPNPNFLQGRDAILQGDLTRYASANSLAIWDAFAQRGMGLNATAPVSTSTIGIVENYTVPSFVTFSYAGITNSQLAPGQATTLRVNATPANLTLINNSGELTLWVGATPPAIYPMTQVAPGTFDVTLPAAACFESLRYRASVNTNQGRVSDPNGARTAVVFTSIQTELQDTGETNEGWIVTNGPGFLDGAWERATPLPSPDGSANRGDPRSDFDGVGTGKCWLTENNLSSTHTNTDVDGGSTFLTSRSFPTSAGDSLSFAVWLNSVPNTALGLGDGLTVQYSLNAAGTTWQTFRTYTTPSNTWRPESFVIGATGSVPASLTTRIRFVATDSPVSGDVVEAAMDAFTVSRLICDQTPFCAADYTQDGGVDGADVAAFFIDWQASQPLADVNLDGGVDGQDVELFFLLWQAGGC